MGSRTAVVALCVALLALGAHATSAARPAASSWVSLGRAASDDLVEFFVGLRMDAEALDRVYHEVTDFGSAQRGQYLSVDELRRTVAPSSAAVDAVSEYLSTAVKAVHVWHSLGGDVLRVVAPVAAIETAFGLRMERWQHLVSGRVTLRSARAYTIPAQLAAHVDVVVGLTEFFESHAEERGVKLMMERRRRTEAAAAGTGTDLNMPYIAAINGNSTTAQLEFSVYCKNGMPTDSASNPCSDIAGQPTVTGFHLVSVPVGDMPGNYTFDVASTGCHTSGVRSSVACDVTVVVPAFTPTVFTLTTLYSDGTSSKAYTHPTAFRPRPPTTPESLASLYSIPGDFRVASNKSNCQAVVSFEQQYFSESDLHSYWKMFDVPPSPPTVLGPNNVSMPGGEATLDIQMITGMGQNINTTFWSFPVGDYIMNWAWAVGNVTRAPFTTSISYGDTETGYEFKTGYGIAYIRRMNLELQKMAVRGYTVFAGAGDAGWTNVGEMGNDLSNPDPTCGIMRAFFPSESPYVTSMSASFVFSPTGSSSDLQEATISVRGGRSWTTGGGFSNLTGVQSWQAPFVAKYLEQSADTLPPASMFNASGRGYPDLVAVGDNNICIWYGAVFPLGGTSASGPIMAGIASLLNDALLNKGLPTLGHFNPTLYRWASLNSGHDTFNDVTVGQNNDGDIQPVDSTFPIFCENGFHAAPGWDAATGLGSPVFAEWVELALSQK